MIRKHIFSRYFQYFTSISYNFKSFPEKTHTFNTRTQPNKAFSDALEWAVVKKRDYKHLHKVQKSEINLMPFEKLRENQVLLFTVRVDFELLLQVA